MVCDNSNIPAPPPPAPLPDPAQTEAFAISLNSIFFNGGVLGSTKYDQLASELGANGAGHFFFAYGYAIDPNVPSVASLTAWTAISGVPEPGTLVLLSSGLLGLAPLRPRNRKVA